VVVLILTGGAVDVAGMMANPKVGAIIHAGQPSVTVTGAADLIFGKKVPAYDDFRTIQGLLDNQALRFVNSAVSLMI
jgi:hypothetical protein